LKFESKTAWSIARRSKKPRKAQKGYLVQGKAARPTKGMKSGKPSQNGKKELRKTQKHKKLTKTQNLSLTLSMQVLP
jgi:hypothetical protein